MINYSYLRRKVMGPIKDVFICHASEDRASVVKPLLKALDEADISYWYAEAEIMWGDSIVDKVNEGLRISRYVIVILSESFISKPWPERELNSVLNIEASTGEVRVLPLLVGSAETRKTLLARYPLLNDKLFVSWDSNIEDIVKALSRRLKKSGGKTSEMADGAFDIPLPKIKKAFTQLEKDRFLREAFQEIKTYFQKALRILEQKLPQSETDFVEVTSFKFIASVYVDGNLKQKCKIWVGGLHSSDSIAYAEGYAVGFDGDDSFNDWLTVKEGESDLGLEASGMWFGRSELAKSVLPPQEAARYFWERFISHLQ
jgi:TIR domain